MNPGAGGAGERAGGLERIVGTGIHVAGLQAEDRRLVGRRQGLRQAVQPQALLVVHRQDLDAAGAEADQTRGTQQGIVAGGAGENAQARSAGEAFGLHVDAAIGEQAVAGGGQGGGVGHLAAGDEGERGAGRNVQQRFQPGAAHLLQHRGGGTCGVGGGVLVPGGGEPVGGDGGGIGAADHPAEEAAGAGAEQAGIHVGGKGGDDAGRVLRRRREIATEGGAQSLRRGAHADGTGSETTQVCCNFVARHIERRIIQWQGPQGFVTFGLCHGY
jgi:hypothetical protein